MDEDIKSWVERLDILRKCVLEPEKCTHDRGKVQKFDIASIDKCLGQIISEMEQYLTKKRLFHEMKRKFQKEYNELLEEIERIKKEFAPGDKLPKKFVLETPDIVLVCTALTVYRVYLEKEMKRLNLDGDDPHFVRLDTDHVHAKELRAILHDALNGRFVLIFKKSN